MTSDAPAASNIADIDRAAELIRGGAIVVAPTGTVFGLATLGSGEGLAALRRSVAPAGSTGPLAWHTHSTANLRQLLDAIGRRLSPRQRRVLDVACPGPVQLAIDCEPAQLDEAIRRLGVEPGVVDADGALFVRVVQHPVGAQLLESIAQPARGGDEGERPPAAVMAAIPASRQPRSADAAASEASKLGVPVAGVVDGPPEPQGKRSTLVRFAMSGAATVEREGVWSARYLDKRLPLRVLFVCTGNTCRSPMAAAIARHEAARLAAASDLPAEAQIETVIRSAGAATMGGSPATPDAVDAVGAMDESMARDLENHRSSMLTRDLLNEADVVFTLTRAHADAVLSIDPSMSARVFLLDPAGGDVPDPIGQPRTVYDDTARVIRSHVAARLGELVGQRL